jgi:hypothetical protein
MVPPSASVFGVVLRSRAFREQNPGMRACPQCGNGVERGFRFCPWCALPLRTKLVELFAPHPDVEADRDKALRVSRYFGSDEQPRQVRFSIWSVDHAEAALSLADEEAERLVAFLAPPPRASLVEQLRESLRL